MESTIGSTVWEGSLELQIEEHGNSRESSVRMCFESVPREWWNLCGEKGGAEEQAGISREGKRGRNIPGAEDEGSRCQAPERCDALFILNKIEIISATKSLRKKKKKNPNIHVGPQKIQSSQKSLEQTEQNWQGHIT